MINIKDIEEKKLIIAYFVCRQKGGTGLEYIFRLWTQKWSNEYDLFLDEIYKWINEKYDNKVGRRTNLKMHKDIIHKNNDNTNHLDLLTEKIVTDIEKNFRVD